MQKKTFLTEVLFVNTFANITIIFLPTSEDQECNRSIALEKAERKQSLCFSFYTYKAQKNQKGY